MQALKTERGWIICGKCGHKLAKVSKLSEVHHPIMRIEFKCTSCKEINVWEVKND